MLDLRQLSVDACMMDEGLGSSSSSISVTTESLDGESYDELSQEGKVAEESRGAASIALVGSPPNTVTPQEHLSHSTSLTSYRGGHANPASSLTTDIEMENPQGSFFTT
jgi:hypothetical protein